MTRDDIISMAREAGLCTSTGACALVGGADLTPFLQRFATLVAAKEREVCAKVCDTTYYQHIGPECGQVRYGIAACAAAIRARGAA